MPGPLQRVPYILEDDHKLFLPAPQVGQIPVTNIAYSQAELNAVAGLDVLQAVCSVAAASAAFDIDIADALERLTAGLGVVNLKDIVFFYAVLGAALTGAPTVVLSTATFGAIGAVAAAPVVAAAGGTQTLVPATWPTAISAAGQAYSAQVQFATAVLMNTDLQKIVARLVVPMAVGGTFALLGALLHFNYQMSKA